MRQGRFAGLGGTNGSAVQGRPPRALPVLLFPALAAFMAIALLVGAALADPGVAAMAAAGGVSLGLVGFGLAVAASRLRHRPHDVAATDPSARGFAAMLEASGRAWFWETNADGLLTYVSAPFAEALGRMPDQLVGGRFDELLLVEAGGEGPGERPTLGFHLGARFPFEDVIVTLNGSAEAGWLLSGVPRFDEVGRFLGFRGHGEALTGQRRDAAETSRLARYDSLTGLPNRACMEDMLDEALANAEHRKQSCALFMIDLDRFKQVNDTFGHPAGDVLLQQVAERLTAVIGSNGQVGRLGGDEFQALFPGIGEEGRLAAIAEAMIAAVTKPYLIHGHAVEIGTSVGIAISRPGRTYAKGLVKEADLALYAAKRAGRGTSRFFEPAMHAEETERKILESDLKSAVAKGQLKLLYQPIVDVKSERLIGFEALVRWWHPVRGPLTPDAFMGVAAASNQLPALGDWIIRTACAEAARWPRHLSLAVNVAPAQLVPGLAATLTGALASAGLDPWRLELDLREEALTSDDPAAQEALATLRSLGIRLALDDFGAGATSLASFKAVPLDRLKLHPSFLRSAAQRKGRPHALAVALVRMAEQLKMKVTAEGAETLEDLELIRDLGCGAVQGYLFGRPMPAEEARTLAADSKAVDAVEAARMRPPRHSLIRNGLVSAGGESWPVRLRNISAGGAMVESERVLGVDDAVELDLSEGLRLRGSVRWAQGGRIGIQFAEAFDLGRLGRARRESSEPKAPILAPRVVAEATPRLSIKDVRG